MTLSIGERSMESYQRFRKAGADRYLLRHETADETHYRTLHPEEMNLQNRMDCLKNLKILGYQVGAGFMVGSPNQTEECLAEDLLFLKKLEPQMVGIGPFIPHHDTAFAKEPAGSVELTLYLLSSGFCCRRYFFRQRRPLAPWILEEEKKGLPWEPTW